MNKPTLTDLRSHFSRPWLLIGWVVLIGIFLSSYSQVIVGLVRSWLRPDYGHGFFVPIFALVLLLVRGKMICGQSKDEDWWLNLAWSKGDWITALLRSKTTWIGFIAGAAVAVPFYVFCFSPEDSFFWPEILIAGCYGGVLGGLVLLVAELFRHSERESRQSSDWTWWGLAFFAGWALMRLTSAGLGMERTDEWSILAFAAGVAVFMGGWRALRWAWPSIVFLYFMTPLPGAVQNRFSFLLQAICTKASVYAIQTLGIPAVVRGAEGNVIQLPERQLGVVEACSGIRMLMLFFAICVGAAFVLRCPLWKKAVIVVSAVPIAVFSNVARITFTAVLYHLAGLLPPELATSVEQWSDWTFHKGAGWLMMPLALVLLLALWRLLEKLVVDQVPKGPLALTTSPGSHSGETDLHQTTNP
jgi:exosortase